MFRYVSIDVGTLGKDSETCDVVEFAAIIDDMESSITELPKFHCYITKPKDVYQGEVTEMWDQKTSHLFERIAKRKMGFTYIPEDMLDEVFADWLVKHDMFMPITIAGKNFALHDLAFLKKIGFGKKTQYCYKILDPAPLYVDLEVDAQLPSLSVCLERAQCSSESEVECMATQNALNVIRCLRHKYLQQGINP